MNPKLPASFRLSSEVSRALSLNLPIVALESTVITHGLPYPENLTLAGDMENEIRTMGVTPATIAVLDGRIFIGLNSVQFQQLASGERLAKISTRDFSAAIAQLQSGGTTVAGTMLIARMAGIRVFATGGIGGVHRQAPFDISADLQQLARTPMIVVCAGAKAILDLPATLEYLETMGVPVFGYQTDEFPAFYSRSSGLKIGVRTDTAQQIVNIARAHWSLGMESAILVVTPPPEEVALSRAMVEENLKKALHEAKEQEIRGQQVTPFLLQRLNELTGGASLRANLALLRNNARLAADIARSLIHGQRIFPI